MGASQSSLGGVARSRSGGGSARSPADSAMMYRSSTSLGFRRDASESTLSDMPARTAGEEEEQQEFSVSFGYHCRGYYEVVEETLVFDKALARPVVDAKTRLHPASGGAHPLASSSPAVAQGLSTMLSAGSACTPSSSPPSIDARRRSSSFSFLAGAALGANATLANSSLVSSSYSRALLLDMDSPKAFRHIRCSARAGQMAAPLGASTGILPGVPQWIGPQGTQKHHQQVQMQQQHCQRSIGIVSTSQKTCSSTSSSSSSGSSGGSFWHLSGSSVASSASSVSSGISGSNNMSNSAPDLMGPSFLLANDVQVAGGAAGEDRVQAVCSEENGWLFCGVYDGFNGRDAADFLAANLYENIGSHLRILQWRSQLADEDAMGTGQTLLQCKQGPSAVHAHVQAVPGAYALLQHPGPEHKPSGLHASPGGQGLAFQSTPAGEAWPGRPSTVRPQQGHACQERVDEAEGGTASTSSASATALAAAAAAAAAAAGGVDLSFLHPWVLCSCGSSLCECPPLHTPRLCNPPPLPTVKEDEGPLWLLQRQKQILLQQRQQHQQQSERGQAGWGVERLAARVAASSGAERRLPTEVREAVGPEQNRWEWQQQEQLDLFQQAVCLGLRRALAHTERDFFRMVEHEMEERPDLTMVGSCVMGLLIHGQHLFAINLGDSRAVLATWDTGAASTRASGRSSDGGNMEAESSEVDSSRCIVGRSTCENGHGNGGAVTKHPKGRAAEVVEPMDEDLDPRGPQCLVAQTSSRASRGKGHSSDITDEQDGRSTEPQVQRLHAVQLSQTHCVDYDAERMRVVMEHPNDPSAVVGRRVKGKLRVTRAFGAGYLKSEKMNNALIGIFRVQDLESPPYVSSEPYVMAHRLSPLDQFVVIGSDGLFDFFSNEEVVEHVARFLSVSPHEDPAKFMLEQLLIRAAERAGKTVDELKSIPRGKRRKYHDDVTVIVITLGHTWRTSSASTLL